MAHPRPESVFTVGLHHGWAREGKEVERGTLNGKCKCEVKMREGRFMGGGGRGIEGLWPIKCP